MNFLLDTNVLPELRSPQPDCNVLAWLDQADEDRVYLSVISIARSPAAWACCKGRRQTELAHWHEHDSPSRFDGRVLAVNAATALA